MPTPENLPFQLDPGERLLWSGTPRKGILFRGADIVQVPVSILFVLLFANQSRNASFRAPIDAIIWSVLFVAVMYFAIGRFLFDSYRRRNAVYALTSERMLIRDSAFSNFVKSFPLNTITDTGLRERRNGFGNIWIGRRFLPVGWQDPRLQPTRGHPMGFAMIPNASYVYDLLEQARLTRPAPTVQSLFENRGT
jgi:hypothetical protein